MRYNWSIDGPSLGYMPYQNHGGQAREGLVIWAAEILNGAHSFKTTHKWNNLQMDSEARGLMNMTKANYRAYLVLNSVWVIFP